MRFLSPTSFTDTFWEDLFNQVLEQGQLSSLCNMLWLIWCNRNKCLHEQWCYSMLSLMGLATNYEVIETRVEFGDTHFLYPTSWEPPPTGFLKINVDTAFSSLDYKACSGVVIRDSRGLVQCSAVASKDYVSSAFVGELQALLFGLDLAHDPGN
ncbi:hypothetical protein REPUB_Repub16aG0008000 [Reevesia pubescens]